tara:strand:+ start:2249 stop:2578 length:330 start_codon:yes stop_codon:yes gene_type:complete
MAESLGNYDVYNFFDSVRKIISFLKNATSSSLSKPNHGRKELEEKDAGVVGQIPDSTMQKLMKEGKLVSAEEQHKGGMDMEVVLFYVLSMGHILFILALIFFYLRFVAS